MPFYRDGRLPAVAAAFALALSACGGGGSGPGAPGVADGTGPEPPSGQPGLTAGGVTVELSRPATSAAVFKIGKGGTPWTVDTGISFTVGTGWATATRYDAALHSATGHLFAATDIEPVDSGGKADANYLAYGFWNKMGPDPAGSPDTVPAGDAVPFHYGSQRHADMASVTDKAVNYQGGAAGGYKRTEEGTTTRGLFYGTVALTANFAEGTIDGTISGIKAPLLSDEVILADPVSFNSAAFAGDNFSGTTAGGGSWNGFFYGPSTESPTGVAGQFTATAKEGLATVALTGSYGVHRE